MPYPFIATAAFGLEGVVAGELNRLGLPARAELGGARFSGEPLDAMRANLWLRTADRVLMVLCERDVLSFEDLYQAVSGIAWETLLPRNAAIPVSGKCVKSQLMSVRDCQAVAKKAIVNRLMQRLRADTLPETGAPFPVDVAIHQNHLRVTLDMSGDALNRRGYRTLNGEAPLRETLAAALLDISPWRPAMPLYDPCCGTGTLLIEAAMRATHRAPGSDEASSARRIPLCRGKACWRFAAKLKPHTFQKHPLTLAAAISTLKPYNYACATWSRRALPTVFPWKWKTCGR